MCTLIIICRCLKLPLYLHIDKYQIEAYELHMMI